MNSLKSLAFGALPLFFLNACGERHESAGDSTDNTASPIMNQVTAKVRELALSSGFSDEDAIVAAEYVVEKWRGPLPNNEPLRGRIANAESTSVSVLVSVGTGVGTSTYEVTFTRGDVAQGARTAYFQTFHHHPAM